MNPAPSSAAGRGDTRERIVRSATGLFRRVGVSGAGIGAICERAGVTKGVFSHHFPGGKDQLVVEVVERSGADVAALLRSVGPGAGGAPGPAVEAAFRAYGDLLRIEGTDFGCPVAASVVDTSQASPTVRRAAGEVFRRWSQDVADGLGGIDAEVGMLLVAALEGAILLARAQGDPAVLDRTGAALAALL